jgi:hypothetical protein
MEPRMSIIGLPQTFEPGAAYDVTIRWAFPEDPHGVLLEIVNELGVSPAVEIAREELAPVGARCDSAADGPLAAYVVALGARKVVGVRDCRATELSFRFVAPDAQRLAFSASAVRSDSMGTAEGDGVSTLRVTIPRQGLASEETGCALADSGTSDACIVSLLLLLLVVRNRVVAQCSVYFAVPLLVSLCACYQPEHSAHYEELERDGSAWYRDAGLGEAGIAMDGGRTLLDAMLEDASEPVETGFVATRLYVRMGTASYIGRYAPSNIGAIWIEDAQRRFVKTLARWARTRASYLYVFQVASGGDLTDAVTSATLDEHVLHEVTWNLTDSSGMKVPKGDYEVVMEMTDRDGSGPLLRVPFSYGDMPFSLMPAETAQFKELLVRLDGATRAQ